MLDVHEVVVRLIGPVRPTGCSGEDDRRLTNLRALTELTETLLDTITDVAQSAGRYEASVKALGQHAMGFLNETRERFGGSK
jgi:hypothetical protein